MTAQQKSHRTHKNGSPHHNRVLSQETQKGRFWVRQVSLTVTSTTGQHGHGTARSHLHTQRTHDGPSVSYCSTDPHCYFVFVPNTSLIHRKKQKETITGSHQDGNIRRSPQQGYTEG